MNVHRDRDVLSVSCRRIRENGKDALSILDGSDRDRCVCRRRPRGGSQHEPGRHDGVPVQGTSSDIIDIEGKTTIIGADRAGHLEQDLVLSRFEHRRVRRRIERRGKSGRCIQSPPPEEGIVTRRVESRVSDLVIGSMPDKGDHFFPRQGRICRQEERRDAGNMRCSHRCACEPHVISTHGKAGMSRSLGLQREHIIECIGNGLRTGPAARSGNINQVAPVRKRRLVIIDPR